jgi:hypothetical protein
MKFKFPGWMWVGDGIRALSAIPLTLMAVAFTLVLWLGNWPSETAAQRIQLIGFGLIGSVVLLGLALFLVKDGIKSLSAEMGAMKVKMNSEDKDEQS